MCYCTCEVVTAGVKVLLYVWVCYCRSDGVTAGVTLFYRSECVTAGVTFLL